MMERGGVQGSSGRPEKKQGVVVVRAKIKKQDPEAVSRYNDYGSGGSSETSLQWRFIWDRIGDVMSNVGGCEGRAMRRDVKYKVS